MPPDLNWDLDQYREELTNIDETAIALTVNFDRWTDLRSQIEGALADKALVPTAASGFLVKPEARGQSVNIPKLVDHPSELSEFDVIGIAAKEIGHSLLTRCRSIVTLRSILQDAELDLPIHIFGAITPMEILSFFLCGADIFDGLNWLRYAYREQDLVRMEDYATCEWDLTDAEIHLNVWSQNLRFLNRLQGTMRAYANCEATMVSERFERHFLAAERIAQVAGAATQRVV